MNSHQPVNVAHGLSEAEIAVAAYFIWANEGRPSGFDKKHWDTAIQQLLVARIADLQSQLSGRATLSGTRITYCLPTINAHQKLFNKSELFSAVDWGNWPNVINGFEARFVRWYFDPLSKLDAPDDAYPVLCAACALIDVFTYYDGDRDWHSKKQYQTFLRKLHPALDIPLSSPITISRNSRGSWVDEKLHNVADVFYAGVRCSLLHHGDLASYAGMQAGAIATEHSNAGSSVCGNHNYSLVVFDPWKIWKCLESWFRVYCDDLRAKPKSVRAKKFRERFAVDFGISIP